MLFNFFVGLISLSYPYPNFPIFDWKHGIKHLKKNSKDFLSSAIAKCIELHVWKKPWCVVGEVTTAPSDYRMCESQKYN